MTGATNEQNDKQDTILIPRSVGDTAQPPSQSQPLYLYSTTVSDVGTVRSNNQDSSFAGSHLIAVCDGMGGHAGGDTASTIAVRSLAHIELSDDDVASIAPMMTTSVMAAHDAIVGKAKRERRLAGMGTTVTAVSLAEGHWVITHIGDSRAYLLRDGKLRRMTQDHSYVQHLIDTGHITAAEARNHPQRNVVMRVLGDFDIDPRPDIGVFEARPSDRWLLCSDGLCGVLEDSTIEETMVAVRDEEECAQQLVAMALKAGSTDNVTAVIGDATLALDADSFDVPHQTPLVGGAASSSLEAIADIVKETVALAPALRLGKGSPAQRAAALAHRGDAGSGTGSGDLAESGDLFGTSNGAGTDGRIGASVGSDSARPARNPNGVGGRQGAGIDDSGHGDGKSTGEARTLIAEPSAVRDEEDVKASMDTGEIPVVKKRDGRISADPNDPEVARAIRKERQRENQAWRRRRFRMRVAIIAAAVVALIALLIGGTVAYRWSQSKYYLGQSDDVVAIYQGVSTNVFGLNLSHEVESTGIELDDLPQSWNDALEEGISFDSLPEARSHAAMIKKEVKRLQQDQDRNGKNGTHAATPLPWPNAPSGASRSETRPASPKAAVQ
ncbi:Serine/threonine protein phosphatase PrpC [Bifidobacterium bohemicum]|uniref:Phosphoprotein phosphatase n=1 Tax=Bifidobacterium bohemicum DSM 22767 TaxID=1437606 RepID=A0A086ZEQ9_9BIFI|nr:phosphoprotein phosphatase [Bifidobacterium bohemicum DSM 22767]SCC13189.1 Serine/threonine protein phosphatase PrpC [Bifidobacterium bohemicum]